MEQMYDLLLLGTVFLHKSDKSFRRVLSEMLPNWNAMPIKESVIGGWQLKEADCPGEVETLFQQDLTVTGLEWGRKRKIISNLTLFRAEIFIDRKSSIWRDYVLPKYFQSWRDWSYHIDTSNSQMVGEPWKCDAICQESPLLASWGQRLVAGVWIFVKIWRLL